MASSLATVQRAQIPAALPRARHRREVSAVGTEMLDLGSQLWRNGHSGGHAGSQGIKCVIGVTACVPACATSVDPCSAPAALCQVESGDPAGQP